jgi:hypothetical protein
MCTSLRRFRQQLFYQELIRVFESYSRCGFSQAQISGGMTAALLFLLFENLNLCGLRGILSSTRTPQGWALDSRTDGCDDCASLADFIPNKDGTIHG